MVGGGSGVFAYAVSQTEDPFAVAKRGRRTARRPADRIRTDNLRSPRERLDNVLWRVSSRQTTCMAWYPADDDGDEPHPAGVLRSRFGRRPRRRRRSHRRGRRAIRPTRLPRWTGHPRAVGVSQPWSVERPACPGARHPRRTRGDGRSRARAEGVRARPGPSVGRRGVRGRHHAFSRRRHDGRDDHVRVHGRRRVRRGRVERRVRHDPSPRRFDENPNAFAPATAWRATESGARVTAVRGTRTRPTRPPRFGWVGATSADGGFMVFDREGRGSIRAEMSPGSSIPRMASFGSGSPPNPGLIGPRYRTIEAGTRWRRRRVRTDSRACGTSRTRPRSSR